MSLKFCLVVFCVASLAYSGAYPNRRSPSARLEARIYDESELTFLDRDGKALQDDDELFDSVEEMETRAAAPVFPGDIPFDRTGCRSTCEDGDRLIYCFKDGELKVRKEPNSPKCCRREERGRASCARNQYGVLEKSYCPRNYRGGERVFLGLPMYGNVISKKDCTSINSAFYCMVEHLPNLSWNDIRCERNGRTAYCKRDRLPYPGSPNRPLVCFHPLQNGGKSRLG